VTLPSAVGSWSAGTPLERQAATLRAMGLMDRLAAAVASALPKPIDPAVFGDPLALQTQWTPLVKGGASFGTHRLVEGEGGLEFKKSVGMFVFAGAFFVMGLGGVGFCAVEGHVFGLLVCLPFAAIGAYMLRPEPLRFDTAQRQFVTRKEPVPFSRIRALQLLPERVESSDGNYTSYELNLVLEGGERINVVDHGGLSRLRDDAARVAALLGCPLWDAVGL
jgi:hypothetical protein